MILCLNNTDNSLRRSFILTMLWNGSRLASSPSSDAAARIRRALTNSDRVLSLASWGQAGHRLALRLCDCAVDLVYLRIALVVVGEVPALYILIVRIKRRLNNVECV